MRNRKPILLLEDDEIDVMTVKRALTEIQVTNKLEVAGNGEEGLAYLRDQSKERPTLILLDLNMPKMNGIEFLRVVKQDENLKQIPVVVLTTSKQDEDIVASFKLCVAGYMLKPVDYMQFVQVMRVVRMYWTLSELPE